MTIRAKLPEILISGLPYSVSADAQQGGLRLSLQDWADISGSAAVVCDEAGCVLEATRNTQSLLDVPAECLPGARLADICPGLGPMHALAGPPAGERTLVISPERPPVRVRAVRCGTDSKRGLVPGPDRYLLLLEAVPPVPDAVALALQECQLAARGAVHQLNNLLTVFLCRKDLLQGAPPTGLSESQSLGESIQLLSQAAVQIQRLRETMQACAARLRESGLPSFDGPRSPAEGPDRR